jgi:SH3-like domain-containing protein
MPQRRSRVATFRSAVVLSGMLAVGFAAAAEFRVTAESPAVLYDAPSAKAKPLFVYGRDVPVEILVNVEGWTKVRDASGSIGWIGSKALADKRVLLVRVPMAEIRANPDDGAPIVFRAEHNVLLELAESASSPATTATPGWVKVRHRDGQSGFVRLPQIFGF